MTKVHSKNIAIKSITQGAFTLVLIFLCFFFITGVLNILNALFVPLLVFLFSQNKKIKEILMLFIGSLVICILFFDTQLIFLGLYFFIGQMLLIMKKRKLPRSVSILLLTVFNALTFWGALITTDFIFGLNLNNFMIMMFNGNSIMYVMLFVTEGLITSILLTLISDIAYRRLSSII